MGFKSIYITPPNYEYIPKDQNLLGWNYSPIYISSGAILTTAGTVYGERIHCPTSTPITNLYIYVTTGGATLTAGQCFAGLYDINKNLIGSTADQSTNWQSAGLQTMALVGGPYVVTPGDLFIAFYANGSTLPSLAKTNGYITALDVGLSAANYRCFSADTGRTTSLPASLGAFAQTGASSYWVAIS
jgi:hypothetical protein